MFKNKKEPVKTTLFKYEGVFVTIDGEKHYTGLYKWAYKDALVCSVPEYIMRDANNDGYIQDDSGTMYILCNIKSIKWIVIEMKEVYKYMLDDYKIFYTNDEVEKMVELYESKKA